MLTDPTHLRGYGLKVTVNGQSARLLLDTGASGLLINRRMAEKAGVKPVVHEQVYGIGDQKDTNAFVGYADSIKVGGLEFQNCLVEVSEKRSIVNEDGLIGADVFGHFLVTLDFPKEKLELTELLPRPGEQAATPAALETAESDSSATGPEDAESEHPNSTSKPSPTAMTKPRAPGPQDRYIAPEMAAYTKVFRFGHELLIPTKFGESQQGLFLIDSGAVTNFVAQDAAREVTKVSQDPNMHVHGLSGSVKKVYSADELTIQFAHFRQKNLDIMAFDLTPISRGTGTEVSGIIGFTLLRMMKMKIDYRDGLVDFEYQPSPWER